MNYKLARNTILYGIGDFVVTASTAFLLIPLYLSHLSISEYGIFNVLNNNTALLTYIFQFGLVSAFSRIYFIKKGENKETSYIGNIIVFHFAYSFFLLVLLYFGGQYLFGIISPAVSKQKFLLFSVIMAFISFVPSIYYVLLRIEEKVISFVSYQLATVIILLCVIFTNVLYFELNLNALLFSFILTYSLIWLFVLFKLKEKITLTFNIDDITQSLKFSFPIFIGYITYFLMSKYSLIILQKHVSLKEIGYFSIAQQIAMIPTFISVAITKALQPFIFSSITDEELKDKSFKVDKFYKIFIIWVVGSLILSVDLIIPFFFGDNYTVVIKNIQFLLLVTLLYNFTLIENSILLYKMKGKILLFITISGAFLNVLLCNLLIIPLSVNGVIISMGIAYFLTFTLESYFSKQFIRYSYDSLKIIVSVGTILFYLFLKYYLNFSSILLFGCQILVLFILSFLLIISIKEMRNFKSLPYYDNKI